MRCGKCTRAHSRAECTARASYCANCTGNHLASDRRCPRAIEVKRKIAERHRGSQERLSRDMRQLRSQHRQHQRRSERAEKHKKATRGELPELPLLHFSDSDLTRLGLFISAHTILYARTMYAGTMELDDIPHIASKLGLRMLVGKC